MKKIVFSITASLFYFLSSSHADNLLVNGSFEAPEVDPMGPGYQYFHNIPGWQSSDPTVPLNRVELWTSGSNPKGFDAYDGDQFAELSTDGSYGLWQDLVTPEAGFVDYAFAHRGREGEDTLLLTITYFGLDGVFGTGDDEVLVDHLAYTASPEAWVYHAFDDAFYSVEGGTYRFQFDAFDNGGYPGLGNFLDAVTVGIDAVPEPSSAMLLMTLATGYLFKRRKA